MKTNWLVEHDVFSESLDPLVAEIKRQGMKVEQIRYIPFESGSYNVYGDEDCVLCYGSLNLIRQLRRQKTWVPGSFCNLPNFECSHYFAHFGKWLLNDRYTMMSLAEMARRKEELFDTFGDPFFIRPSTGFKTFAGQLLSSKHFDKDSQWFFEFSSPESLIVVSKAVDIKQEWRCVIARKQVIAASQYKIQFKFTLSGNVPTEVIDFASGIAQQVTWEPDPIYVMDIARCDDDTLKLIEINSFSCSGLYACDVRPVVEVASELALKEWEEINAT